VLLVAIGVIGDGGWRGDGEGEEREN